MEDLYGRTGQSKSVQPPQETKKDYFKSAPTLNPQSGGGGPSKNVEDSRAIFKGRVHVFFIRELDVPPLEESILMGTKKSVEVKFFTRAFFFWRAQRH